MTSSNLQYPNRPWSTYLCERAAQTGDLRELKRLRSQDPDKTGDSEGRLPHHHHHHHHQSTSFVYVIRSDQNVCPWCVSKPLVVLDNEWKDSRCKNGHRWHVHGKKIWATTSKSARKYGPSTLPICTQCQ